MDFKEQGWVMGTFLLCFLIVGVPYWLMPYNEVTLPNAVLGPGLLTIVIFALILQTSKKFAFKRVMLISGLVVPAVVFVRVCWDIVSDPTSHNLWPFEIIIAIIVGFVPAFTGALLGNLVLFLDRKNKSN